MTYQGMGLSNGRDAGIAWESLVRATLDTGERGWIEKALRAYCGQDTMALVRLLEKLHSISSCRD